ncbi:hypothetical protein [Lysobacter sp. P5_B9]
MKIDKSIPGYTEMSDWPMPVTGLLQICAIGWLRDGATYTVDLEDAGGNHFPFFFDKALGRLCFGWDEISDNAGFIKRGSRLEMEAFAAIEDEILRRDDLVELKPFFEKAKHWAGTNV